MQCFVIPDERVAGYVGLGMAQVLGEPVVLVCTSGTAVLNLSPAVAEAYFAKIPLLVLTADRPPEWVNQQDGQTIFQQSVFGKHVMASYQLPADYTHPDTGWFSNRIINHSANDLINKGLGPVHINVPVREPFYPVEDEAFVFNESVRKIEQVTVEKSLPPATWASLLDELEEAERVIIVAGQGRRNPELAALLLALKEEFHLVIVSEVLGNLPSGSGVIASPEALLTGIDSALIERLRPDLLITFGGPVLSKRLKNFIRSNPPRRHWHLQEEGEWVDTFQSITRVIPVEPIYFFRQLLEDFDMRQFRSGDDEYREGTYLHAWQAGEQKVRQITERYVPTAPDFNEFSAAHFVLRGLPTQVQLHVANSMIVRYVSYIGMATDGVEVFANRGTSGIDGCLSTAVGASLVTNQLVISLIGDIAFFYDRNALWHPYVRPNLRIVLFNNHGGGIFRLIDGPGNLPEREKFFETPHDYTARRTAEDANLEYHYVNSMESLRMAWPSFVADSGRAKLLEIETAGAVNQAVFEAYKQLLAQR